jgi:hypothetical protein
VSTVMNIRFPLMAVNFLLMTMYFKRRNLPPRMLLKWVLRNMVTMGAEGPFPGVKRGRGVMLTTHPHLVPRLSMSRSYTSFPPRRLHGV